MSHLASPSPKPPLIALFNYGGGMRGLIPAHFMQRIEETTGLHMAEMVDIFMGPSTGSILNAALNVPHPYEPHLPKYKARHMVRFYEREGIQIFPQDSFRAFRSMVHDFNNRTMKFGRLDQLLRHGHYERTNLGRSLRALFGRSQLSDSLNSLIIPVYSIDGRGLQVSRSTKDSYIYRTNTFLNEGGHALWLKNIKFEGAQNEAPPQTVGLFDAVMGSTAAPTYFPCHTFKMTPAPGAPDLEISGIDGSIFDNPCISYMGALRPHIPADRDLVVIALGTGYYNRSIPKEEWNRYGSLGVVDPGNDMPLINILFYASETALLESFAQEIGKNLYMFNKSLLTGPFAEDYPSSQIDDASPENLRKLKNFFEMTLEENRKNFETVCHLLVNNRDRRQSNTAPPPPPESLKNRISRKLGLSRPATT